MYNMWVAMLKSPECGCLLIIGLQRDDNDEGGEGEGKNTVWLAPFGSDKYVKH